MRTLGILMLAAWLEIGGDALIRYGMLRSAWTWLALGVVSLIAYGLAVNVSYRSIDFGQLLGLYIAVFFGMSQLLNFLLFGVRPSSSLLLGGALIVAGGIVIHFGTAAESAERAKPVALVSAAEIAAPSAAGASARGFEQKEQQVVGESRVAREAEVVGEEKVDARPADRGQQTRRPAPTGTLVD